MTARSNRRSSRAVCFCTFRLPGPGVLPSHPSIPPMASQALAHVGIAHIPASVLSHLPMRTLRSRRWRAALAVLLLLVGALAPALERMSCSMGCPTVIAIGSVEGCCSGDPEHHDGPTFRSACCTVDRTAPEHHAFTTVDAPIHLIAPEAPGAMTFGVNPRVAVEPCGERRPSTRPPPLLTAERLSLERSYLI